jgi:hypothetical protein
MQGEPADLERAIENAIDDVARSMTEGQPSSALRGAVRARIGSSALRTSWWRPSLVAVGVSVLLAMWIGLRDRTLTPPYVSKDIEIAAPTATPPAPIAPPAEDLEGRRPTARRISSSGVVFSEADAPMLEPLTIDPLPMTTLNVDGSGVPLLEIPAMEIAPLEQIE